MRELSRRQFVLLAGAALEELFIGGCRKAEKIADQSRQIPSPIPLLENTPIALKPESVQKKETPEDVLAKYTDPYSPEAKFERARVLKIDASTSPRMIELGKQGELFFKNTYPKLLCEVAFQREAVPYGDAYMAAAARGIVNGIKTAYPDRSRPLVLSLDAGHMSNAPTAKIDGINRERRANGLAPYQSYTWDTGTSAAGISERSWNHRLAEATARLIIQDPESSYILPVLNSRKDGFPVDRIDQTDDTYAYIQPQDAIIQMNWLLDMIGLDLQKTGEANMAVLSIHHNDAGDPTARGGFIYAPNVGSHVSEGRQLANSLAQSFESQISQVIPGYNCSVQDPFKFFWDLDVYDGDNPAEVANGLLIEKDGYVGANYGCVSNLIAAKLRHSALTNPRS